MVIFGLLMLILFAILINGFLLEVKGGFTFFIVFVLSVILLTWYTFHFLVQN